MSPTKSTQPIVKMQYERSRAVPFSTGSINCEEGDARTSRSASIRNTLLIYHTHRCHEKPLRMDQSPDTIRQYTKVVVCEYGQHIETLERSTLNP